MTYSRRTLLAVASLAIAACADHTPEPAQPVEPAGPPAVATVRVRASVLQVGPGDTLALSAEALDARGAPVGDAPVTWQWSDSGAFLGTAQGNVLRAQALRTAVVTVTAQSGAARGTIELNIRYTGPAALRFTIPLPESLTVGAQPSVTALAVDSAGRLIPGAVATVTSSDSTVASVRSGSAGPILTALRPGRTEVVATLGSLRIAVAVRVWGPPRIIFPDTSALTPGLTRLLGARELPVDQRAIAVPAVGWRSSAPDVATVSTSGVVTGVGPGQATISAIVFGDTLRAQVVVRAPGAPTEYVAVVPDASCAITREGAIDCWGENANGELGTTAVMDRCESYQQFSGGGRSWTTRSTFRCSALPVRVQSTARFVSASGSGSGVCGLTDAGAVECWGMVPTAARSSPVPVPVAPGLKAAAVDGRCILTTSGEAHCWGDWTVPIFEDGTRASQTPQRVPSPVAFRRLAAGDVHLCGVTATDAVYCWGSALGGAVGATGSSQAPGCFVACEPRPRLVEGLPPVREVWVGRSASCALDRQGVARCWGTAYENGRTFSSPTPAPVPGAPPLATLARGRSSPCGLTADGATWCWGGVFFRVDGSLALSTERAIRAAPDFAVRALAVSVEASCAISATDARLYCFGQGPLLGDGDDPRITGQARVVRVSGQR